MLYNIFILKLKYLYFAKPKNLSFAIKKPHENNIFLSHFHTALQIFSRRLFNIFFSILDTWT